MATVNPFGLLGDGDAEDPSELVAAAQKQKDAAVAAGPKKVAALGPAATQKQPPPPARLPSKPLPPSQAAREAKNDTLRSGGRSSVRGYGRGRDSGGGFNQDFVNNDNSFRNNKVLGGQGIIEGGDTGRTSARRGYSGIYTSSRGGRRGGFSDAEAADLDRPRRAFERQSGTGRGSEFKREGSGRGNWGTPTDEFSQVAEEPNETEKAVEKPMGEEQGVDGTKETPVNESEEKEAEDKEMTLEEYEKVLEEKRKALQALKTEERKVDVGKEFGSMQPLSSKKSNDDVFIKLGSDKDKKKEAAEKEEKAKRSVSINEFLKPAEGERYYNPSGRGRGRGRGGVPRGFGDNPITSGGSAPAIEDPGQFPTLGGK